MEPNEDGRRIKALEKSIQIIDTIQELNGARVIELAEHLDLPPSTVHIHLATLERNGYLVKEGDVYHIGLKFLNHGGYASHRKSEYTMAIDKVHEIANRTGERAQFIAEEHGIGFYIHTATGDHAVQVDARIGKTSYIHASAAGKAILANLPSDRIESLLNSRPLIALTENTITDRESLSDELDVIRDRGYSLNMEESIKGLRAVGAPLNDRDGRAVGALSVSGPTHRMKGDWLEKEIPDLLLGTVNEIELNIAYS